MTLDEVNSITGKKLVIFRQKKRKKEKVSKMFNLSDMESLWCQSVCLNSSDLNLLIVDFGWDMQ